MVIPHSSELLLTVEWTPQPNWEHVQGFGNIWFNQCKSFGNFHIYFCIKIPIKIRSYYVHQLHTQFFGNYQIDKVAKSNHIHNGWISFVIVDPRALWEALCNKTSFVMHNFFLLITLLKENPLVANGLHMWRSRRHRFKHKAIFEISRALCEIHKRGPSYKTS